MSRWIARCVRLAAFMGVLVAMVFGRAQLALAEETAVPPADAPIVLQPDTIHLPPIPADFEEQRSTWLHASYPAAARERALSVLKEADALRAELSHIFGVQVLDHVEVRITRSWEEMAALAPREVPPPRYASGVAYSGMRLVLITLKEPRSFEATDLGEVFRHELSHVALEDATGGHHVPRWFNEGVAIHVSGELGIARVRALSQAALSGTLLPLAELDRRFPDEPTQVSTAYAESADFVRFLLKGEDEARFASLVGRVKAGVPFQRSLADAYGTDLRKLEYQWREDVTHRYSLAPALTGGSLLWVLVIGALVVGYVKKRRRSKATLDRWAEEEAMEDALREKLAEERMRLGADVDEMPVLSSSHLAAVPKVEHDGNWHTVH